MDANQTLANERVRVPRVGEQPGCALLWRAEEEGWTPQPLHLSNPILLLRVNAEGTRVETPEGEIVAEHEDRSVTPFHWMEEILKSLGEVSAGTERRLFRSPIFPLAIVCASYEYGRVFYPHEHCFPHSGDLDIDEVFVAFHCTGFVLREGRWAVVGRPPGRGTSWRDWKMPREYSEWPKPPVLASGSKTGIPKIDPVPYEPPAAAMQPAEYEEAVRRIHGHLESGDIYQANLTVRFEGQTPATADEIFAAGLREGGDRYGAIVQGPGYAHVSFSPELFLRKWGRSLLTKPIKGTRARPPEDLLPEVEHELALSEKDRAEHVMIVDLERNDLGRLCEFGTIRVDPLMEVTRHPRVLHLESTVWGTIRPSIGLREAFAATFPGGSVTGAPKRRALEIIADIESRPRGIYCGALGWIDCRGDCELNLPIRTATLFDSGRIHLYSGGGIVADSTPEEEWAELRHKLRFLVEALKTATEKAQSRADS